MPTRPAAWSTQLGDSVVFYKLGLELFMSGSYDELLDWMVGKGKRIFADLKFFDIPATVGSAVRRMNNRGITFTTVHGNQGIMEAAVEAAKDVKILAVTVLTSLDRGDLDDLGFQCDVEQLVVSRARRALAAGVHGVVSSGMEAEAIRRELGPRLMVVTPGIRPVENRPTDDQKRVLDRRAGVRGRRGLHRHRPPDPRRRGPARRPPRTSSSRSRRSAARADSPQGPVSSERFSLPSDHSLLTTHYSPSPSPCPTPRCRTTCSSVRCCASRRHARHSG
jgi:orotidine 5'-phosphate decarboxylase subfamily 1